MENDQGLKVIWGHFLQQRIVAVESKGGRDGQSLWVYLDGRRTQARCFGEVLNGACLAVQLNSGEWLLVNTQQPAPIARATTNLELRRTKPISKALLKVKTLFSTSDLRQISLGGYKPHSKIIDLSQVTGNRFITNFGTIKYLATVQFFEDGKRKYLFNNTNKKVVVTNNITSGYEFYMGNGLWETTSGVPQRSVIVDGAKQDYVVSISSGPVMGEYNTYFAYPTLNASTKTWLPEGEGFLNFIRTRDSIIYDRPPIAPINVRNPRGFIVEARYGSFQIFKYILSQDIAADSYYQQYTVGDGTRIGDTNITTVSFDASAAIASVVTINYTTTFDYTRNADNDVRLQASTTIDSISEQIYVSRTVEILPTDTQFGTLYLNQWFSVGSRDLSSYRNYKNSIINIPNMRPSSQITGTAILNGETTEINDFLAYTTTGLTIRQRKDFPPLQISYNDFAPASNSNPLYTINIGDFEANATGQITQTRYLPISFPGFGVSRAPLLVQTTDNVTIRRTFVPYIQEPPPPPPISIKEESYTDNVSGDFVAIKTTSGYIRQQINLTKKTRIVKFPSAARNEEVTTNSSILTYRYQDKQIVLNLGNFLIIKSPGLVAPINQDSTSLAVNISISSSAITRLSSLVGAEILYNYSTEDNYYLVKAVVSNIAVFNSGLLRLTANITSFSEKIKTSFQDTIISNNGSFYNYLFRKSQSVSSMHSFASDNNQFIKLIALNPIVGTEGFGLIFSGLLSEVYESTLFNTDNFVKNKIYSVVEVSRTSAVIEQWDISDNGAVKFVKVFSTPYSRIPQEECDPSSIRHSFHP